MVIPEAQVNSVVSIQGYEQNIISVSVFIITFDHGSCYGCFREDDNQAREVQNRDEMS